MEITSYIKQLMDYCAYRERAHSEVREKAFSLGYNSEEVDEIIVFLIQENFLNEQRFAESYTYGKFEYNKWGKIKIIQGLKQKDIPDSLIKKALKQIDNEAYELLIQKLIEQKAAQLNKEKNIWIKKKKIKNFLIQRGFEFKIIDKFLNHYFNL